MQQCFMLDPVFIGESDIIVIVIIRVNPDHQLLYRSNRIESVFTGCLSAFSQSDGNIYGCSNYNSPADQSENHIH